MDCYICHEPNGYHTGRCHEYEVPEELVGPKNSKDFMVWFLANQIRAREEAALRKEEEKAYLAAAFPMRDAAEVERLREWAGEQK